MELQKKVVRVSRIAHLLPDMLQYGVVELAELEHLLFTNKLVIVPKKNGRLRLIQDCRPINERLGPTTHALAPATRDSRPCHVQ